MSAYNPVYVRLLAQKAESPSSAQGGAGNSDETNYQKEDTTMASKKQSQPVVTTTTPAPVTKPAISGAVTVAIDIGYGVVKAMTENAMIKFPSVCGHARTIKYGASKLTEKHPGDQIWDDDGAWFIGDLALTQLLPGELLTLEARSSNQLGDEFRLRMFRAALGKLFPGQQASDVMHIRLATGLPVNHMPDAARFKAMFLGQHFIKSDNSSFIANVTEVMVMPQPYGAIYANMLTDQGDINPCHVAKRTGVIDVGRYTVDLTTDDDGEYVDTESGSIEGGVWMAQQKIGDMLQERFKGTFKLNDIESVLLTKCLRIAGTPHNFDEEVGEALEPLTSSTLGLMNNKWGDGQRIDVIYIAGGGAPMVQQAIRTVYPQARLMDDPQMANVRGYLYYALFAGK